MFYCSDEMYIMAGKKLPPDEFYEDYPQLENGVGMMRLLMTEFEESLKTTPGPAGHPLPGKGANQADEPSPCRTRKGANQADKPSPCRTRKGASQADEPSPCFSSFSVATGVAAGRYLTKLLKMASAVYDNIFGRVYAIRNDFFGESVTVSGLITGGDIISQLKGRDLGSRLLIPLNMLRRGDDVFLDDVTVRDVSEALGVPVRVVGQDGADLLSAFLGR